MVLLASLPPDGLAQEPQVVELAPPYCDECGFDLEPVIQLGDIAGDGILESTAMFIVKDSRGRYYLSNDIAMHVKVFDPDGHFIKTLGREGEGPGEFKSVTAIALRRDSLLAFDSRQSRFVVFDAALEFARSDIVGIPADYASAVLDSGWVVNGSIRTPDRVGQPLHYIRFDGLITSFGSRTGVFRPDLPYVMRRAVAAAGPNQVLSGWLNQYVIELWEVPRRMEKVYTRSVAWFEPYWQLKVDAETPPAPVLYAMHQEGDRLWVLLRVADPAWKSEVSVLGADLRFFDVDDPNGYYDSILELIDTRTGRVLISDRIDQVLYGFAGPGLVYGPVQDEVGNPFASLWRARPHLSDTESKR